MSEDFLATHCGTLSEKGREKESSRVMLRTITCAKLELQTNVIIMNTALPQYAVCDEVAMIVADRSPTFQ